MRSSSMPSSTLSSITPSSAKSLFLKHAVERFGLRHGAGKSVEDETLLRIRFLDAIGHDADNHLVRHQFAAIHDIFCL